MIISCKSEPNEELITLLSDKLETLVLSSGSLEPAFSPFTYNYQATSLNSLAEIQLIATSFDTRAIITVNGVMLDGTIALNLNPGEDIVISVGRNAIKSEYRIKSIPYDFPLFQINSSESMEDGQIFFTQHDPGLGYSYIAIINKSGQPLYYKKVYANNTGDFKKILTANNKVRYSYVRLESRAYQPGGGFRGSVIVMDENFNELNVISAFITSDATLEWPENHDFILLDDDHYVVSSYVVRKQVELNYIGIDRKVDLVDLVLQEVQNQNVIFEWNSKNYPEFLLNTHATYQQQLLTSNNVVDYLHFNSIFIDKKDNNFIISARHLNQVFKINRIDGNILWRLGGSNDDFNLPNEQKFSHQHHATVLQNGNLLLFDNGNTNSPQVTRIMEFSLDESSKLANLVWMYLPENRYSNFMGSAQRLENGNTFIGMGGNSLDYIQANKPDILEVNNSGEVIFELSFVNQPKSIFTYRAFKY